MQIIRILLISTLLYACGGYIQKEISPEQIDSAIESGEYTAATQMIWKYLSKDSITPLERYNMLFKLELMERIKKDFSANDSSVVAYIKRHHPNVTPQEIAKWEESNALENITIDGKKRYFNYAARNLFRIDKDAATFFEDPNSGQSDSLDRFLAWHIPELTKIAKKEKKIFVALPGVPYEMKSMMNDFVIPEILKKKTGESFIKRTTLLTTGIPESVLYERLGNLDELLKESKLAFLPSQYGVRMRITVSAEYEESASNKITEIEQKIRGKVGRFIYGKNNDTLEAVVGRLLKERGLTIAVAESCTGGNIMNLLTNISGSSKYVERGFVSYSNGSKVELLQVDEDILAKYGSVSLEVARQMAEGVKAVSGTDIGLAATGIMGPTGASEGKPVGLVYIGICDEKVCTAKKFLFGDDRLLNKERTTYAALELLRRHLLGIPIDD